jgi:hypothetical protein
MPDGGAIWARCPIFLSIAGCELHFRSLFISGFEIRIGPTFSHNIIMLPNMGNAKCRVFHRNGAQPVLTVIAE